MSFSPNNLFKYKTFWPYNYLSKNIVPSQNTLRSDIEKRLKRNMKYCDKWTTDVHEIDIHIVRDFSAKSVANFLLTFTSFNRAAVVHEIFPPKYTANFLLTLTSFSRLFIEYEIFPPKV